MVWNRTVCFTVHSAYHYEWQHQFNSRSLPAATGPSMPNHVWNILWKLKVPCKKKKRAGGLFMVWFRWNPSWQIGTLGMMRNVRSCLQGVEDIFHLLFSCGRAVEMWRLMGISHIISGACQSDRSGSAVLEYLLQMPNSNLPHMSNIDLCEEINTACLYLWWLRRRQKHGEEVPLFVLLSSEQILDFLPHWSGLEETSVRNHQSECLRVISCGGRKRSNWPLCGASMVLSHVQQFSKQVFALLYR